MPVPSARKRRQPGVGNPNRINRCVATSSGFFSCVKNVTSNLRARSVFFWERPPSGGRHLLSGIPYPAEPRPLAVGSGGEVHEPNDLGISLLEKTLDKHGLTVTDMDCYKALTAQ